VENHRTAVAIMTADRHFTELFIIPPFPSCAWWLPLSLPFIPSGGGRLPIRDRSQSMSGNLPEGGGKSILSLQDGIAARRATDHVLLNGDVPREKDDNGRRRCDAVRGSHRQALHDFQGWPI